MGHKSARSRGATGRLWDIADKITRERGRIARRKEVIERYVAEGGNANTASTQYHHWKNAYSGGKVDVSANVDPVRLKVAADGRLVIPAEMRRAMQVDPSGRVTAQVVDGELRVVSPRVALAQARALVRAFDKGEGSPVDELLHERRVEVERE